MAEQLIIEKTRLKKLQITDEEYLALLLIHKHCKMSELLKRFLESGQVIINHEANEFQIVDKSIIDAIEKSTNSKAISLVNWEVTKQLAQDLINLYPKGIKPDTNKSWRGSLVTVANRLYSLQNRFQLIFEPEKVIAATKLYLQTFEVDNRTMRTLPYFIWRNDVKGGVTEFKSDLLDFLDLLETGEIPQQERNWITELR